MQDYPQHLFLAQLTESYHQPAYNWKEFYRVDLGLRPYMLWYLAMRTLAAAGAETAGKILFSLYILLITLLALAARRLAPGGSHPWGALLLFPLAFHQMYFLGFSNYIISLPLLFLAVLDLDQLAQGLSGFKLARHAAYPVLLLLSHPYSALVYMALAATSAFCSRGNRPESLRRLIPAAATGVFFAAWYLALHGPSSAPTAAPWSISWWPLGGTLPYYLLLFTGMRWYNGPDRLTVGLWCLVALLLSAAWRRRDREDPVYRRLSGLYLASLAGVLVLPFWMGYYSYFNLRLAPVSYFALSLLSCRLRVSNRLGAVLGLCVLALLVRNIQTQRSVVRESETVLPVVSSIRKNALILPLVCDAGSRVLDPVFFYQIHAHEADYYHLLVGGGANPTLFPNAMMPVQYRPGLRLPWPETPGQFTWRQHGAFYDYVLVRQAPPELRRYLALNCDLVASSGPWVLFRNRSARKPLLSRGEALPQSGFFELGSGKSR